MLPIIKVENERGEVLDFSTSPRYLAMLTGTGSPAATINRSKVAVADGTRYNSATVGERNLLLTIYLRGDIARARMNLYRFFATKSRVKIYYQADDLDVFIEGYVETAEVNPWEQNQNMQVSIICPMPFWQDVAESYTDASSVEALFEFPFSIEAARITDTVVWDGDTEGHFIADGGYVKVSDAVPTSDDLANGFRVTFDNGISFIYPNDAFSAYQSEILAEDNLFVIISDRTSQWFENTIDPELGVYLNMAEEVRKLTIYGYTGFPESSDYRDTLTWDGTTEGKITVENMVKVSDAVPTMADFENGYAITFNDGRVDNFWTDNLSEEQDLITDGNRFFIVALANNASPGAGTFFPEAGIYLAADENIKSLTIYGYTGLATEGGGFANGGGGVELSVVDPTASAIIENNGTVPAGVIFEITATVASHSLRIYNLSTGEFIGLDMELQAGDRVLINTTTGHKSAVHIRDGVRTNCINAVVPGSSWLQMAIGPNEYSYTVHGECTLGIYHTNMYIGV